MSSLESVKRQPAWPFADDWSFACAAVALFGAVAAAAGVIIGIARAFHRVTVTCPDGAVSPCYAHPNVGEGAAIAFISVALLALIVLAALITKALAHLRSTSSS